MSHIYDALRKSHGGKPERSEGDADSARPPPEPPPAPPTAEGEEPLPPLVPEDQVEQGVLDQPESSLLQELDALRENLDVLLSRQPRRVVGFTGAVPDEGTTTVAMHYAYLLTRRAGKRVLLIDGDMARSRQGLSHTAGEREGLSEVLRADIPLEKVILRTAEPNLHFFPAGQDRIHHVEAVSAGRLRPLLDDLGQRYETVVVDCAPVFEHPEVPLIGSACDGVVFVARARRIRRELAQRALGELDFAGCRILGTVLNSCRTVSLGTLRERV